MYCKKSSYLLVAFFLFFYIFNYLTPMAFGDDYVYSFVWEGHSMYVPLSEEVRRVATFHDLLISQWSHYFTGNGRAVSHTIVQIFLWAGKDIFNIFNALVSVLLILEIYWCAHKGIVTFNFRVNRLILILFSLWSFTLSFSTVFFWLSASCNYLWTAVLLLGFLMPYIRKYYFFKEKVANNEWFCFAMFFIGVVAGWSNENNICWIILILSAFIYANKNSSEIESWMITGLVGLAIGYVLLIFAPGNVARLYAETGASHGWVTIDLIKTNLRMLVAVFCFQFMLWYFNFRSFFILQKGNLKIRCEKYERLFLQVLCIMSFGMTVVMIFSPNFPPRSAFLGTVLLIIAIITLLRLQEEYQIDLVKKGAKNLFCVVGSVYFTVTTMATLYGFYEYHMQIHKLLSFVQSSKLEREDVLTVPSLVPVDERIANMSGLHILFYEMSEDDGDWRNVAFSRYYGIKGIRMTK